VNIGRFNVDVKLKILLLKVRLLPATSLFSSSLVTAFRGLASGSFLLRPSLALVFDQPS